MVAASKNDTGQEHGEIQHLGSPILSKIQQAFMYIRTIATGKTREQFTSFRSVEGARNLSLHLGWNKAEARLIVSVKMIPDNLNIVTQIKKGKLAAPAWLEHLAGGAQVEVNCLSALDSVIKPENTAPCLKAVIDDMTGNVAPRRIVCVGFCVGGSVATLAATWAAVQWPTADVRCISFGSSAVGNAAFGAAFKWLVGLSYRVMFRRDPVPAQSTAQAPNVLKHVHGAVYICGDGIRPGCQSKADLAKADMGDHSPQAYMGALNTNCKRQSDREASTGGVCGAKGGAQCVLRCPIKKRRQRREQAAAEAAAAAAAARPEPPTAESMLKLPHLSMRESMSSVDDSQDGDMDISSEPTGLGSYVRAGMGSLVMDTATVSKAAFASTLTALRGLGKHSSQSTISVDTPLSNRPLVSVNSENNLDRTIYGAAQYDADIASGKLSMSNALQAAQQPQQQLPQQLPQQQDSGPVFTGAAPEAVQQHFPEQQLARSMFEAVMVQKGLASPESFKHTLPELMCMTPDAKPAVAQQTDCQATAELSSPQSGCVQGSSNDGDSTARAAGTARSAYGGEPGEQWVGSQSPDQVARAGLAVAAENEAAAQASDLEPLQQLEEGSLGSEGLVVLDAGQGEAADQQSTRKLTRAFSLLEKDSSGIDQKDLSNLQKVLVVGKISQAAILAAAAYRNHETFKLQTGITNSRLIYDREHHDTKVHVGWLEGGTAVFAFRGTASRQDGLQDVKIFSRNIDYLQELYPGVKAHLGFLQQFAAVCHPDRSETNMAAVLKELSGGQTPNRVICCGHSLGGALATLGAAWAALEYPDADIRCITFGSPRVANKVFGKAFNALVGTSLRVVHGFDPVPSLPPSLMYKHVPGVIHIKRHDLLLKHRPWHTMLRSTVSDHGMMKYSKGIYKHMPGGLEALPSFFAPKPVKKMCENICKVTGRSKAASQDTPHDLNDAPAAAKSPKQGKGNDQAENFWAGSLMACWGSGTLDEQDAAAGTIKTGIQESDANAIKSQITA